MSTITQILQDAQCAARNLAALTIEEINEFLGHLSNEILHKSDAVLAANVKDLAKLDAESPEYKQVRITETQLREVAFDIDVVAGLPSSLGRVVDTRRQADGMTIKTITVARGVVGVNVGACPRLAIEAWAQCLKTGSACILGGSTECDNTLQCIVTIARGLLDKYGITPDLIAAVSTRQLAYTEEICVIDATVGVGRAYIDRSADIHRASAVVFDAKFGHGSERNSLGTIIIDKAVVGHLPEIVNRLASRNVAIHADGEAFSALDGRYPVLALASASDFKDTQGNECVSIVTVNGIQGALQFITSHNTAHNECIIAENPVAITQFVKWIDGTNVAINVAPKRLLDGLVAYKNVLVEE